jgi:hypothetical protein
MTKYQCNVCSAIFSDEWDAIRCHPDINVIEDDASPKRDAAEHPVEWTGTGLPLPKADTSETDGDYWLCLECDEMNKVSSAICQDCHSPRPEHYAIWNYSQARS